MNIKLKKCKPEMITPLVGKLPVTVCFETGEHDLKLERIQSVSRQQICIRSKPHSLILVVYFCTNFHKIHSHTRLWTQLHETC